MTDRQLTDGSPVPADHSHTRLKENGQQQNYVVLTPEERAKGFVKPVRRTYVHRKCGCATTMGTAMAETYARDPNFYTGTFCVGCCTHFPLVEFAWDDGEPMEPDLQEAWHIEHTAKVAQQKEEYRVNRIAALRRELDELEGQPPSRSEKP